MRTLSLAARSLFWTLLFPGFFAGYLPWRYFGVSDVAFTWANPVHLLGSVCIALGSAMLLTCIFEFARSGRGTLSPVDPPKDLVIHGLYRHVRNPMYLAVLTIVAGEIILTRSAALAVYWVGFFTCAQLFVRGYEEPYLRRQFGASYERYAHSVGRWVPRWQAFTGGRGERGTNS
ncbi:MAG TPA: isoprenylcysteine carboxylmethyltransferase family protein [Gemmatimonadaceae bacterium]